jgi:hypothetical protein
LFISDKMPGHLVNTGDLAENIYLIFMLPDDT